MSVLTDIPYYLQLYYFTEGIRAFGHSGLVSDAFGSSGL
jgi:hypothetical protein